ncbi:hypothetical protein G6F57_008543 [Rhizopus arrhizus]|uniref:BHLH domain-containing protein n=1 Tax=Rhizopus oryzae TaxID=64495 RepID=A0A9P6XHP5_RHIOR|nr:hypothetical protein G6F23_004689 [Rhizopus arrhizus]KAG1416706.1 hypothetical protein G6F58_005847 [Rhizopus delemar]KAG0760261.1 hypothetical protein G6F24_008452 [Rhizopus arrhizus]KAG0792899.1 hypothetical protein G6F21_004013 [Rhizopus arrhizus]KAG0799734.1 hypothetical protein G6F22_002934 [Rhizopus arrhizus]
MDLSNFQLVDTMSDMDMLRTLSNNNQQYSQRQQSIITHNSNNYDQFQQDINLLFQSNTSSPHVDSSFLDYQKNHLTNQSPHYRTTSQPDCYPQEDILTPLISPAMTPSFDYQMQQNHNSKNQSMNFSNDLDFSPLSSPAMLPQTDRPQQQDRFMSVNQIRDQYEQLEQEKLLITQKLSELQKTQQQQSHQSSVVSSDSSSLPSSSNQQCQNIQIHSTSSPDSIGMSSLYMEPATPASLMKLSSRHSNSTKHPSSKPPKPSYSSPSAITSQRKHRGSIKKETISIKKKQRRESTDPKAIASPRALKPLLISPTLRPGTQTLPFHQAQVATVEDAERILATRSNYQNLMEGKGAALGIAFTSQVKSGLEVRRTAHKAAEQKRRDSLKEWFDKLRREVEDGYVKRQKSLMSQVIQAQELEGDKSTEDDEGSSSDAMKPLSKVLLLQYAYEYIASLKDKLSEKDEIIQKLTGGCPRQEDDEEEGDQMQLDSPHAEKDL